MAKVKRSMKGTDEKRDWARQWMAAHPDQVTILNVNQAVKKKFGVGFGKKVVMTLVKESKGKGQQVTKDVQKMPSKTPEKKKVTQTAPRRASGNVEAEDLAEFMKIAAKLRSMGIVSLKTDRGETIPL